MEENKLFFKTNYAGENNVNWPEVINLITDDPIKVIFIDGTVVEGFSRIASVKMIRLETEKLETPSDSKLSEVAAINPGKKPVVKITARTNVGLTQERGNTDTDKFRLDGEFIARTEKRRLQCFSCRKFHGLTIKHYLIGCKFETKSVRSNISHYN
jgi:hypothetical protein